MESDDWELVSLDQPVQIGAVVKRHLERTARSVRHPERGEFSTLRAEAIKPLLGLAGERTWKAFITPARLVKIERGDVVSVTPMRRDGHRLDAAPMPSLWVGRSWQRRGPPPSKTSTDAELPRRCAAGGTPGNDAVSRGSTGSVRRPSQCRPERRDSYGDLLITGAMSTGGLCVAALMPKLFGLVRAPRWQGRAT
jgi:hypothetical protein